MRQAVYPLLIVSHAQVGPRQRTAAAVHDMWPRTALHVASVSPYARPQWREATCMPKMWSEIRSTVIILVCLSTDMLFILCIVPTVNAVTT